MSISTGNPDTDAGLAVGIVCLILLTAWILISRFVDWLYKTKRLTDNRPEKRLRRENLNGKKDIKKGTRTS